MNVFMLKYCYRESSSSKVFFSVLTNYRMCHEHLVSAIRELLKNTVPCSYVCILLCFSVVLVGHLSRLTVGPVCTSSCSSSTVIPVVRLL